MLRERNTRLLISLVLLSTVSVTLMFYQRPDAVNLDKDLFRLTNPELISRVVMERNEQRVELTFESNRWKVGGEDADRGMIDVLFATATQAEPGRKISAAINDSIKSELLSRGVKVTFFEGDISKLSFYAGGDMRRGTAWFLDEATGQCYAMVIPGYRVYVSGIYIMGPAGWKDRRIFNFNWRNFKELTATYHNSPKSNFHVLPQEGYFKVEGVVAVDTARLNEYLDAVSLLRADQRVEPATAQASPAWQKAKASFTISVTEVSGRSHELVVYSPETGGTQVQALINGREYVLLDKMKVVPLARTRDYFVSSSK